MDPILGAVGGAAATFFALDLVRDMRRGGVRPHTAAYAAGIGMFAVATWAFVYGTSQGWDGPSYRVFFLFGAILNIPTLAIGSMFLVVGRKSGNALTIFVGAISAISITLVSTVPFENALPEGGVPTGIFAPPDEGFGPRLLAAIGSGTGATLLIVLALVSIIRFWRRDRRIAIGNLLIVAGVFAASAQGTIVGLGGEGAFGLLLLVTATLLWLGYRVTKGRRRGPAQHTRLVLLGPSTSSGARLHNSRAITLLEGQGFEVFCPADDLEEWGDIGVSPAEITAETSREIDRADLVLADLRDGYGVVMSGYALAKHVPVIVATPEGSRIPRPLRGIALAEIYYTDTENLVSRFLSEVSSDRVQETGRL